MKVYIVARKPKPRWSRVAAQRLYDRFSKTIDAPQEAVLRGIEREYLLLRMEEMCPARRRSV